MNNRNFSDLGLAEPILRALRAKNYTKPTPIQAQAIPPLLQGRDMLGVAQTGTGKTAAFALPILQRLARKADKGGTNDPRALILAPTRELAIQIGEEFAAYGKYMHLRHSVIYGGVSQKPQANALRRGVDVVIATPGRLLDLMSQRLLRLDAIEVFVLDEADRMLDMGFVRDIRKILAVLPRARQSLLFSATMPREVTHIANEILDNPVRIEIARQSTPVERITQSVYHVMAGGKIALLAEIMSDPALSRVIVFTRTKHRANRVAERLGRSGVDAEAIHGNKSQGARQRALKRFRAGDARVLVATDIAARGIDVDGVTHVINFELPNEPESYVHRIGRTARAGSDGIALSFCDPNERAYLKDIERLIRLRLTVAGNITGDEQVSNDDPVGNDAPGNRTGNRAANGNRRGGRNGRQANGSNGSNGPSGGRGPARTQDEGKSRSRRGGGRRRRRAA